MPNNKTTTTFGHNLFRRCVVGRQNNVLSTLIFIDEGQKTLIQCNGPVSNILVPRYDPMLHTTVPCWLQRPVCSATSHCPPCYEGDNENQLLDQRCRHNIKIICNLSSRDPAAQTTAVHSPHCNGSSPVWGVKGVDLHQPCVMLLVTIYSWIH